MIPSKRMQVVALAAAVAALSVAASGRADGPPGNEFPDTAAIERWAKESYFGGAHVTRYSHAGRELVVVNGSPTSGLLTSQIVVLGRAGRDLPYHMILKSAVFMSDVKVSQGKEMLTACANGTTVFAIPFEAASLTVHNGL